MLLFEGYLGLQRTLLPLKVSLVGFWPQNDPFVKKKKKTLRLNLDSDERTVKKDWAYDERGVRGWLEERRPQWLQWESEIIN